MTALSRHYVVTGASSGIGAAVVTHLTSEGYKVTGIARRDPTEMSDLIESIPCDLSNLSDITASLGNLAKNQSVDGLVCCHGFGDFGGLEQFSEERIRKLVDTNLTSNILLARLFLPAMKSRGHGSLILIGSEAAVRGGQQGAVYCATKFGLRGLAQSLREECSSSGIRVCLINPGMVDTPFFDSLDFAPGLDQSNALLGSDVAEAVVLALKAPAHMVVDEINLSPLKKVVRHR